MKTPLKKSKRKPKSKAKLINDCAVLMQKLVRLKAADHNGYCQCVSCGTKKRWQEMQGGHYIERGKTATKLLEENIHPQCPYCNFSMAHSTHVRENYRAFMIDMYGEDFHKTLLHDALQPKKYSMPEIRDLLIELKDRVKEREENLNAIMVPNEDAY